MKCFCGPRKKADVLILPFYQGKKAEATFQGKDLIASFRSAFDVGDFQGKEGEHLFLYPSKGMEKRILCVGLGEKKNLSLDGLRKAYASAVSVCQKRKVETANIILPKGKLSSGEITRGASEGVLLANYAYTELKRESLKKDPVRLLKEIRLIGAKKGDEKLFKGAEGLAEGVYLTRNLANANADDITPERLAQVAKSLEKVSSKIKTKIFDKKRIEKEKMGLLLAVNRGSFREPRLIFVEYKGAAASRKPIVLVGKGITYDTGGLNLKPTGFMETMKHDMTGGATVLGVLNAAARLNLKENIIGVIPSTENSIGSRSYKPGDVYVSYCGKSVEIGNTDAEGRLVLADAISYSVKNLKPRCLIDIATLTGGVVVALGEEISGYFTDEEKFAKSLAKAASSTGEEIWRLPIFKEYKKHLKSDFADLKNIGNGRKASSVTAALFLHEFIGKTPWIHFDIAGSAWLTAPSGYNPKNATGACVRLLVDWIAHHVSS